jgi:hypothetical protein
MRRSVGDGDAPVNEDAVAVLEVQPPEQRAAAGRWLMICAACDELQLGRLSMLVLVRDRDDGLKILV